MATPVTTEAWLSGPLPGIPPLLQPVAHALVQARDELNRSMADFPDHLLSGRPAGVASPRFHLRHLSGVLDRTFTYARGEGLNPGQFAALAREEDPAVADTVSELLARFSGQVDRSLEQLKKTAAEGLTETRGVGRAGIPSTQLGLLVHAAEHTMRHLGQLLVTAAVLKGGYK